MIQDDEILNWLQERLCAHEGGAPAVQIGYDDATFHYVITQKKGFGLEAQNETLGASGSLSRAFKLAISGDIA